MIIEYITTALKHARYEIIEDDEPYYGEVSELPGISGPPERRSKRADKIWPVSSTNGS